MPEADALVSFRGVQKTYDGIDASLVDGGQPPLIIPLTVWAGSWPPKLADVENAPKPAKPTRQAVLTRG